MSERLNDACECALAGYCTRHGVEKSKREHELCAGINCTQSQCARYWVAWENGRMRGQGGAPPDGQAVRLSQVVIKPSASAGLGDRVSQALATVGVTQERVSRWLGVPCNCDARKEKLNSLGRWVGRILRGAPEEVSAAGAELSAAVLDEAQYADAGVPLARALSWTCGLTTVPSRRETTLPGTLTSLERGGFPAPRLFVDGDATGYEALEAAGHKLTYRGERVRTMGNWALGLLELYFRNPHADVYAMFQDDVLLYRNLRAFVERSVGTWAMKAYLNLYTVPLNEKGCPGWRETSQRGKGALALVFDRAGVVALMNSAHLSRKPQDPVRGHRRIDGGIVTAMNEAGYREWCYCETLVQHTGLESSMGNRLEAMPRWRGEQFDALELL